VASYRVALAASAERELNALSPRLIARIVLRLEHLAADPRPSGCKKLRGGDQEWRIRIDDGARTVDVTRIAHRREAYR